MILRGINRIKLASIPTVTFLYLIMFTPGIMQVQAVAPFDPENDHECSDAKTSDSSDRQTSQTQRDLSRHSMDFVDEYNTGLDKCHDQDNGGDGSSESKSIRQPQFSSQSAK